MKKQLKDICETITKGTTPTTLGYSFQETGINFVKIESINSNGVFEPEKFAHISDDCNTALRRSQLKENDILFSIAGAIGRTAIVNKSMLPANTNQALAIIRLYNNEEYNLNFLRYQLSSEVVLRQTERQKQGVAQLNLSLKDIGNLELYLPSLSDQQKIAAELDTIQSAIDNKKQQLSLLDETVKSEFVEMFGENPVESGKWKVETLGDVCSSIVRGPFGSALKKDFFVPKSNDTVKVYEQKHAIQKSADIGTYYITNEKYEELKRFECKSGDFLMSCSGTMGEFYQLPEGCEKGIINQALCKFTLNNKLNSIIFLEWMKYSISNLETKGSGIKNVAAVSFVKQMPMFIPPKELQDKFSTFVQQIDKSKFVVKQQIADLQELLDSKMQQYFA